MSRPPGTSENVARIQTPRGEAAVELLLDARGIRRDGALSFRLANRGGVDALTGLVFTVERWDGESWVTVPWPDDSDFPAIGITLVPGAATSLQQWAPEDPSVRAGWYRIVKSALIEDLNQVGQKELVVKAGFEVHE